MSVVDTTGALVDPYEAFITTSRYARWLPEENRRETWKETVDRLINFYRSHVDSKFNGVISEEFWKEAHQMILEHDVMPSMRALMTAGPALERENIAAYNCSFVAVDNVRVFDEALYILMNGVGLGFSVETEHVTKLPVINEHFERSSSVVVVDDSKAGWARAYRELIAMLYAGQIPSIDVTKVRPAGARLKTFGGRASGPQPLIDLFDFTVETFKKAAGRKLSNIEAHDIMCKIAEVVVVGGVRRSALISLSDLGDYEMSKAKSGNWWESNVQRALSNNSATYYKKPTIGQFLEEWTNLYESRSGERGIVNMEAKKNNPLAPRRDKSKIQGTNPCAEIDLRSNELCNLTEVVVKAHDTRETLADKVRVATVLGTIQSSFTNFKYVRKIWKDNCEEERLLGVSLTGQFGNKLMSGQEGIEALEATLDSLRTLAIAVNEKWATEMGINPSAAITTVKPSGTVSQKVSVPSGMHPAHAEYYIRSVRGDNKDPLTQFMKDMGIPSEPDVTKPDATTVFYFPRKSAEGTITRNDLTAIEHLNIWKSYKTHWTEHNPSVTISVREEEWIEVAQWVWENWDIASGLSFLPFSEHTYQQAPYQDCDQATYNQFMAESPKFIDWSLLSVYEFEDTTTGSQSLACTSGACELVDVSSN